MIEAAKKANAHEFVVSMESGYDTPCGEKGGQLSGELADVVNLWQFCTL